MSQRNIIPTKITTRTSSPSTTSRMAGCATSRRCTSSTAWWGPRAGPNGSPFRTVCREKPISQRAGARRFVFALRGQLALVQRCQSDKGRHSFMTGQPSASGNVFLDCKATSPYLIERAARAVGDRRPVRQYRGAADRPVLEEHQYRLGRRQYRVLELQGRLRAEAADGAELHLRPHWRERGCVQHSAAGHDEGERPDRVAGPPCDAAKPVSHAAARTAWRAGGAECRGCGGSWTEATVAPRSRHSSTLCSGRPANKPNRLPRDFRKKLLQ